MLTVLFRLGFCTLVIIFSIGCGSKLHTHFLQRSDIQFNVPSEGEAVSPRTSCRNTIHYIPDTLFPQLSPIHDIRVNVHFMNSSDKKNNLVETEAVKYAHDFIFAANKALEKNHKMRLPMGNMTPVFKIPFRYQLTPAGPDDNGIYFHDDDALYYYVKKGSNRNNYNRDVIKKYTIGADSILNIFFIPHHPDSVISPTYRADGSGIALGTAVKLAGQWKKKPDVWSTRSLLNHEVGHIMGLSHSWSGNDGCDDTPKHPNCWNKSTKAPCDSLWSNNLMDYNAYQNALSPCQIGRILKNIAQLKSKQRKLVEPAWCSYDSTKTVWIRDSVNWEGEKDLSGDIVVTRESSLRIRCRISLPEKAKIVVEPGATLILDNCLVHNACGGSWQGIEIQSSGKNTGKVIFNGNPRLENMIASKDLIVKNPD
jgi:hypothetical protein